MFSKPQRKAADLYRGVATKASRRTTSQLTPISSRLHGTFSRPSFGPKKSTRHHASVMNHPISPLIEHQTPTSSEAAVLPEVSCVVRARIPTTNGTEMFLHLYKNSLDKKEHLAIVFGNDIRSKSLDAVRSGETEMERFIRGAYTGKLYPGRKESHSHDCSQHNCGDKAPLVRIHSECYTGETVWSARCDCGEQLDESAHLMGTPGNGGIIIYLRQEGRGIGLGEKLKAYNLQDLGSDTVEANLLLNHPADGRSYGLATAMLLDLGQKDIRLMTNNPEKVRAVEGPNQEITVKEVVPMVPLAWKGQGGIRSAEVEGYLKTKIEKMSHML